MTGQNILSKAAATVEMRPTTFKTGSDGFRGQGKVIDAGRGTSFAHPHQEGTATGNSQTVLSCR